MKKEAYWLAFMIFDLIKTYISTLIIIGILLIINVEGGKGIAHVLLFFPLAIIPYSYTMAFIFEKEITAQSFTIYINFVLSGVMGMIIFVLRMIKPTAYVGDQLLWVMRFVNPLFSVCDAFMFTSTKIIMQERRDDIIREILDESDSGSVPKPIDIENDYTLENLGGDMLVLIFHSLLWWVVFYFLESRKLKEFTFFSKKLPPKKTDEELNLDDDVKQEEVRVENEC